jgi:hypothetical protein
MDTDPKHEEMNMDTTSFKENVDDLSDRVRPKIEEAKKQIGRMNGRITGFIQDHPAACLLGALALGYLLARGARHQR